MGGDEEEEERDAVRECKRGEVRLTVALLLLFLRGGKIEKEKWAGRFGLEFFGELNVVRGVCPWTMWFKCSTVQSAKTDFGWLQSFYMGPRNRLDKMHIILQNNKCFIYHHSTISK